MGLIRDPTGAIRSIGSSDTALSALSRNDSLRLPSAQRAWTYSTCSDSKETRPFWWERAGSVGSRYATWLLAFSTKMVKAFQTKRHSACSLKPKGKQRGSSACASKAAGKGCERSRRQEGVCSAERPSHSDLPASVVTRPGDCRAEAHTRFVKPASLYGRNRQAV
jgi:hypothetical protein